MEVRGNMINLLQNNDTKDEVLYYIRRGGEGALARVLDSTEETKRVFHEFHSSPIGARCGVQKTTDAISKRFYWPAMTIDIKTWVMHCAACQKKQAEIKNKAEYTPIEINMGVCQVLGIKRSLCAPYHPQTNGLVEKLNGTIQRCLSKLVGKRPDTWADYLEATMFGLRTKKQITTKFSPYFLMFGREARYPCEVPDNYEINEGVEDIITEECIAECIRRQDTIFKTVQENVRNVQGRVKKRKLEKGMSVDIQVGDRVLRQNIRSRQRKGGKLDPDYLGPYTVVRVEGKSIDVVDDEGKEISKINIDHLIHFLEDHPPKVRKFSPPATVHSDPHVPPKHLQSPALQAPLKFISFLHPVTLPYTHLSLQHIPISLTVPFSVPIPHVGNHPATQYSVLFNHTPAVLQDIWAGKIGGKLCSKVGPYKLFTWDLERLKPGEKLESEVINAYLTCLVRNFSGRAFVLDSFQATNIWKRKANSMKRVNPETYDVLVGSVNENDHWTLLMIYPKERRILYLNSFGESRAKLLHSKKVVSDFMASRVTPTAEWQCQALPHSIQKDGTSCGVFVCKMTCLTYACHVGTNILKLRTTLTLGLNVRVAMAGYFTQISTLADVQENVMEYLHVLSRPKVIDREHDMVWTEAYVDSTLEDAQGPVLMTTVAMPVFSTKNETRNKGILLGVVGTDVPVSEILKAIPKYKLGIHGYAFAITNNGYILTHPDLQPLYEEGKKRRKSSYSSVDLSEVEWEDKEDEDQGSGQLVLSLGVALSRGHGKYFFRGNISAEEGLHDLEHPDVVLANEWTYCNTEEHPEHNFLTQIDAIKLHFNGEPHLKYFLTGEDKEVVFSADHFPLWYKRAAEQVPGTFIYSLPFGTGSENKSVVLASSAIHLLDERESPIAAV
ncbi:voltage-dependent calcium channel subunit alpha-2 delta-3-like isoform X2 [Labeo rohita]|uniref:Voltage-dependent calcium channel subunit alpha-2 delta-3-like isoform X2 n=1 Tax=Labeo rohita TaxID=84645 RepID=A0A498MQK2_LABRO|nr:voltage-dependent calcium channel subunit alpha-2 delta-3-like isoform X2 [Labeo rohita]